MQQPVTKRKKYITKFGNVDKTRGEKLIDPPIEVDDYYFWLRDDKRESKEILDLLTHENNYTDHKMKEYEQVKEHLYEELLSHIKEDNDTYPTPMAIHGWDDKYYYFNRTMKGKSYPLHYRINRETNTEELLLDENILADGRTSFDLTSFHISDDQLYISYGIDLNGSEIYEFKIFEIATKKEVPNNIPDIVYCSYFWYNELIYYAKGNEKNRLHQIWKYNTKDNSNVMIYSNDNELISTHIFTCSNREYFFISANTYDTDSLLYFKDSDSELKEFTKYEEKLKYYVDYFAGKFIILTNKDNSTNFKLMITDENKTSIENWQDLVPYDKDVYLQDIDITEKFMLVSFKKNGDYFVRVMNYNNGYSLENSYVISTDEDIKNIGLSFTTFHSDRILYSQTSLKTPLTLYEYNLTTKDTKIVKVKEVPFYNKDLYEVKRIYSTSHDGVKIPMSLIYKKELFTKDGTNPVYLYGYGSYGHTVDPDFRVTILPLLDRGFVYVIGHVRGGSFLGYDWYEGGKMKTKMNTFLDFISCAEHLISNNYTNMNGITIEGASAGGLLVGASMTMRPDLFRTVIANVPFVDVLNTMSDPLIPLTTQEWEQWGNPNQKEYYEYIKKYCPYTNIKSDNYPNVLALAGLNDPRVPYWEPAKFVSKLRHFNKSDSLILLKTEMSQGHFGGMDRYQYLREKAFNDAYILKTYNLL